MRSIGLLLLISVVAFGQRVGSVGGVHAAPSSGYRSNGLGLIPGNGNAVFPGTGHPPGVNNGVHLGRRPGVGFANRSAGGVVYVPYGVGSYGGSYYEPMDNGAAGYYPQQMPPQPGPPQVVINQNFISETARPVVREYTTDGTGAIRLNQPPPQQQAEAAPQAEQNPTYLIAFKDHTIYAAVAYWVEDGTLHYVTSQNTHNQVSLDLVDRELSDRLNRDRNVDFRLPARH